MWEKWWNVVFDLGSPMLINHKLSTCERFVLHCCGLKCKHSLYDVSKTWLVFCCCVSLYVFVTAHCSYYYMITLFRVYYLVGFLFNGVNDSMWTHSWFFFAFFWFYCLHITHTNCVLLFYQCQTFTVNFLDLFYFISISLPRIGCMLNVDGQKKV